MSRTRCDIVGEDDGDCVEQHRRGNGQDISGTAGNLVGFSIKNVQC
jgi:hypothetical protein